MDAPLELTDMVSVGATNTAPAGETDMEKAGAWTLDIIEGLILKLTIDTRPVYSEEMITEAKRHYEWVHFIIMLSFGFFWLEFLPQACHMFTSEQRYFLESKHVGMMEAITGETCDGIVVWFEELYRIFHGQWTPHSTWSLLPTDRVEFFGEQEKVSWFWVPGNVGANLKCLARIFSILCECKDGQGWDIIQWRWCHEWAVW